MRSQGEGVLVLPPIRKTLILNYLPQRITPRIRQQIGPFRARRVQTFTAAAAAPTTSAARTRRQGHQDCARREQGSTNPSNVSSHSNSLCISGAGSDQCSSSVD